MSKTIVEFTKKELKQLIEDETSCVHLKNSVFSLALFPCHLADFNTSIKQILNNKVARYEKELGGILLGYKNIKLLSSAGTIVNDSCHVHIDIQADFYTFMPEIGSVLKGIVNKVSEHHIGCLVHRLFNIAVPKVDQGEDWLGYFVDIGHEVILNVTFIDLHSRLPYIRATLDEKQFENTEGCKKQNNVVTEEIVNNEENNITETPINKKKKHKSKRNELIYNDEESQNEHQSKKNKKKKIKSVENNNLSIDEISIKKEKLTEENEEEGKEHKRKHKVHDDIKKDKKKKRKSIEYENIKIKQEKEDTEIKNGLSLNDSVKKKSKKHSNSYSETSSNTFNTSLISSMADFDDRKNKKNNNKKISNISLDNIELNLHDSDLESTLNDKSKETITIKKEPNDSFSQESKTKKRKREETSDDDIVKKHKKKKRLSANLDT